MHGQFKPADHSKGDANTIGGYMAVHDRPAAFEGSDGYSYSVAIMSDATGDPVRPAGAYLLFVKWARIGAQTPEGHLETSFLTTAATPDEAERAVGALSLSRVQELLDEAIAGHDAGAPRQRRWLDAMRDQGSDVQGRVLSGTGGVWRVHTAAGQTIDASLRGRLKIGDEQPVKLSVGDDVRVERDERGGAWAIAEIFPRRSQLARRAPGGGFGQRIVTANVDQVVVVFAAANPEPHPRMLDRFLVIAEANELVAHVLVNKVDIVGEEAALARFEPYARAGYPLHLTSAKTGAGLDGIRDTLAGRTSVLTGPSGAGKSSLVNALFPGLNLRVGAISESVNKGRHTTVGAVMVPLPGADGGYVVDTPGLREVGMWALPPEHLDRCFPELAPYLGECRFQDCMHVVEPGCAVRAAVEQGDVSAARYESYVKLLSELEEAHYEW